MRFIQKKRTLGALGRRFERDRVFMPDETVVGPAATHAGDNSSMALRFGTYPPNSRPRSKSVLGFELLWARNAAIYAALSDMERSWLIVSDTFAVGLPLWGRQVRGSIQ